MKFGGRRDTDLQTLVRTSPSNENGDTMAHAIPMPGMRYGGRDETAEQQIVTRIDALEGRVYEHIRENLVPRIAEASRISVKTDKVPFLYYQVIHFGRVCSCWNDVDSGPEKRCPVCWGNTFIPGYQKYGCSWEVVDITYPGLTLVNMAPDYEHGYRPTPFALLKSAVKGYIEATIQLTPNTGVLDALRVLDSAPTGTRSIKYVRTSTENSFTEITSKSDVESRLLDANGNPTTLVFRIELQRSNPDAPLPLFTCLHLRYRTKDDIRVNLDIAQQSNSIELQEHGMVDVFDTIDTVVDRTLPAIQTGDLLIRVDNDPLRDGQRFKVIRVTPWTPLGVLVETVMSARNISTDERFIKIL